MRKIIGLLFLLAATLNPAAAQEQGTARQDLQPTLSDGLDVVANLGKRFTIQSKILGENREILVRLPAGYPSSDAATRYPVIYILDGDSHFGHASLGAGLLEDNARMPESIIVALPNNTGTRTRDLAREMEKFRRFIGEEVFAFIDTKYRTSSHRSLFGHSLAGFFTLSMLAEHNGMFTNYIAASPVVQAADSVLIGKFKTLFGSDQHLSNSVFFTLTDAAEEGRAATDALNLLVDLFGTSAPSGLGWHYEFVREQVHMTTPFLTLYQGLSHVFADYQAPRYLDTKSFTQAGGLPTLKTFFSQRASKYGGIESVPQAVLRRIAYLYRNENQYSEAIKLFQENIQSFPDSPRVYNSLGDGYDAAGQSKEALQAYQTAVKLAEQQGSRNSAFFKRQVARLEGKLAE